MFVRLTDDSFVLYAAVKVSVAAIASSIATTASNIRNMGFIVANNI